MIQTIIKFSRGFILRQAIALVAGKIREDRALVIALREYSVGAPFLSIVRSYALNNGIHDQRMVVDAIDQVKDSLDKVPFRELLGKYLAGVKIPDFDGDPADDLSVVDGIDQIVAAALKE